MNLQMTARAGTRRTGRAIALLTAAGFVLAACGGNGETPPAGDIGGGDGESEGEATGDGSGADRLAGSWDEIVAAAEEEGQLVIAVHRGPGYEDWCVEVTRWMAEDHGITVDCSAQSPSDFVGRIVAEQQAGEYLWDVVVAATGNVQASLNPIGGTQVLDDWIAALPDEVTADDGWFDGFGVYTDDERRIHIHEYFLSGGGFVNSDIVSDLSDPADLLSEEFQGQFVARDPTNVNGGSMSLSWFLDDDRFGEDGLRTLINDGQMTFLEDPGTMLQWVADGRAAIGFGASQDDLNDLQSAGLGDNIEIYPWAQYVVAYGSAILDENPNPNATAVFLAWHLSQAGQETWVDLTRVNASSRRTDVEPPLPEDSPDYENMDQYPPVIGTDEGTIIVEEVTEIALGG